MMRHILIVLATIFAIVHSAQARSCKTIMLDQDHKIAVLQGDTPVWSIKNSGSGSVAIQTKGDPTPLQLIKPNLSAVTVFSGDTEYTYTIGLVAPGKKATLQVCQ